MWRATVHTPEQVSRFRERRAETGLGSVVCHAVYLVNLAGSDRELRERSVTAMRATLATADAIGAEAVIFHPGSHLGDGLDTGIRTHRAGTARAPGADHRPALAPAGEQRRRRGHDRPLTRRACRARRCRRAVTRDSASVSTPATGGPRASMSRDPATLDAAVAELRPSHRRSTGCAACTSTTRRPRSARTSIDMRRSGEGLMGSRLDVFLRTPRVQELPAILETPGPDGHGPDAEEVRRLRDLHRRGVRNARRRTARALTLTFRCEPVDTGVMRRFALALLLTISLVATTAATAAAPTRTLRVADVKLSFAVPRSWVSLDPRTVASAAGKELRRENPQLAAILDQLAEAGLAGPARRLRPGDGRAVSSPTSTPSSPPYPAASPSTSTCRPRRPSSSAFPGWSARRPSRS